MGETGLFTPADILLPQNCSYEKWAVVACDQYTSQPEYWQRVGEFVGSAPSSLRLILPESCLEGPDVETDVMDVNNTMTRYLKEGVFRELQGAMLYTRRHFPDGKLRQGLIGKVDLERYDYEPDASTPVRATEGAVMSRLPPRIAVRKNAPIELPHAILLCDDPERALIEPLAQETEEMELLYDFDLMEQGGRLQGWRLSRRQEERVERALEALSSPAVFRGKYGVGEGVPVLALAVGDGNHSLATAKECYERQKRFTPREKWETLPARYALCELVNLHDASLVFEPIHRVLFGVEPEELLEELTAYCSDGDRGVGEEYPVAFVHRNGTGTVTLPASSSRLPIRLLQDFLDERCLRRPCRIDYIHGADVARELGARPGNLALLLPGMNKGELFPEILAGGALPRKTFSIGRPNEKRYYLEARRIRE